jgi:hypothetical protein
MSGIRTASNFNLQNRNTHCPPRDLVGYLPIVAVDVRRLWKEPQV